MGMPELGTALEQNLPLKIMILNNQTLGMVKQLQDHYCEGRYSSVHFRKNPDFWAPCAGLWRSEPEGYKARRAGRKIKQFILHEGMAVLEIVTSSKENTYPVVISGSGLDEMVGLG